MSRRRLFPICTIGDTVHLVWTPEEPEDGPPSPERPLPALHTGGSSVSEPDDTLDDLDDLLRSAMRAVNRSRNLRKAKEAHRTGADISQDYASRLAEKATFRRLLSDESLDGVRFRWLISKKYHPYSSEASIDAIRSAIDEAIKSEESKNGSPA